MTERPFLGGAVLDGAIRQVGYVVRDLDDAIAAWLGLGVGPWYTIREMTQTGSEYRGEPSEPTISIGFTNSGPTQIELIQQHGDTPSIYREFRDAGGDGYHQLAWWTPDFDGLMTRHRRVGRRDRTGALPLLTATFWRDRRAADGAGSVISRAWGARGGCCAQPA